MELTTINGQPTVVSGVKAQSQISTRDIFFIGGLIQSITDVLTIPISFPATITAANLNDLVALLNKGGWLTPNSPAVTIVNTISDLTIWGPNDPRYGAAYTGWDGLDEQDLLSIFQYSIVQGTVAYSSTLKNNTKYKTLNGEDITTTQIDNDFYVDASKITTRDYICSNGVLQVIDSPLNPNTTSERPAVLPTSAAKPKKSSSGISGAAGAGIGIAIGAVVLGTLIVAALCVRKRRRQGQGMHRLPDGQRGGQPRGFGAFIPRSFSRGNVELHAGDAPPRYELDNKTLPGNGVTTYEVSPVTPENNTAVSNTTVRGTQVMTGEWYGHERSRSGNGSGGGGFILRGYSPTEPGDTKPPSPLEIDGVERSRISITVHGEQPRHLGFQARY